jgi:DNA-binding transcriptional LysR family regulator
MLKLHGLVAFVAIGETGSISAAARRLNLSKSVVSERLTELERELSAKLIQRSTRRLSLTEDGAGFLERAHTILADINSASADIIERRGNLVGPLKIAAPLSFGTLHLGPALYQFLAAHRGVEAILDLDDQNVALTGDGYDMAIRIGQIADNRLLVHRLAISRRILVASPDYVQQNGVPTGPAELEQHRAISYTNRGAADWQFEASGRLLSVRTRTAGLRVNNGEMMRDAALAGLGIALLPTFLVGPFIRDGLLTRIDIGMSAQTDMIYAAFPDRTHQARKARLLIDHLRGSFGNPPHWDDGIA